MALVITQVEIEFVTLQATDHNLVVPTNAPQVLMRLTSDYVESVIKAQMTDAETDQWEALAAAICRRVAATLRYELDPQTIS